MKVTELEVKDFVSTLWSMDQDRFRSPGLHLSTIIRDIQKDAGRMPDRPDIDPNDLEHFAAVGFLWERVLVNALTEMEIQNGAPHVVRVPELFKDGIYLTPDAALLHLRAGKTTLEEWKCKWESSRKGIDDKEEWMMQIMGYCYVLGLDEAYLRVLYVNGNWKPPIPRTRQYNITFTQRDLVENWQRILNHAKAKKML